MEEDDGTDYTRPGPSNRRHLTFRARSQQNIPSLLSLPYVAPKGTLPGSGQDGAIQPGNNQGRGRGRGRNQHNNGPRNKSWRDPGNNSDRQPGNNSGNQQSRYPYAGANRSNFDDKQSKRSSSVTSLRGSDRFHGNSGFKYNNNQRESRTAGFITLEKISLSDTKEILIKVNEKKDAFFNLLKTPIERPDMFVLIMEITAKVCQSPFEQLKLSFILDFCNSPFIIYLRTYLMDLHYQENKRSNGKYWQNQELFWTNFIIFCETLMLMTPSTAAKRCRSLIEDTSKHCLEKLEEEHGFKLPEEINVRLLNVRESLINYGKKISEVVVKNKQVVTDENAEPPENFRELSVLPTRRDLLEERPFLRPNIVNGAYTDVEHYLDVQFRLLREDCYGPLRDGLFQYIRDPTKYKYENIRVYTNVTFLGPYASNNKIGTVVEVDKNAKRRFKNIKWAYNKRFIFGSIVLFTNDNCKTFIIATILDRDAKELAKGKIPISIVDLSVGDEVYQSTYTMIESEVYYEPYSHVLKALQDRNFPNQMAMKKYIVDVNATPSPPAYINNDTICEVNIDLLKRNFYLLDFNTWPTSEELQLNESQYEAYKVALTHEFAVIQGPPGTGKTYLGVNVAKTLLNMTIETETKCVMLLVCYTNHALDQFLEALLPVTKKIVRIGGQSRNAALEKYNLTSLRKQRINGRVESAFYSQKNAVKSCILRLQTVHAQIDSLSTLILSTNCIIKYIPEVGIIEDYYKNLKTDPLMHWLFENIVYNFNENIEEIEFYVSEPETSNIDIQTDDTDEVILDTFDMDNVTLQPSICFKYSFSLEAVKKEINTYIEQYKKTSIGPSRNKLYIAIITLRARIRLFEEMLEYCSQNDMENIDLTNVRNLSALGTVQRWMIYFNWANIVRQELKKKLLPLKEELRKANEVYDETRMIIDFELVKQAEVVGMTTSGAARLRKLLQNLAPPIVIVEEAAEVLEQHIITSLTNNCQHLILIGDHQQLRPSAAHMKLAKHFNIEVSLFERMIKNGIHSRRLRVQHRMRPDIAALISPHIYPDLLNHPSVSNFPNVRGITTNVFFFSHNYKEEVQEDGVSKSNQKEGDMVLHLANYIVQQGYKPEDVTILSTYSGQMFYMRKERSHYAHLSDVKITVVDNYQGEESKIILLSLVRNNEKGEIGFLKTENRICVALSRARQGFYMFGNMDILKNNSELWTKIAQTLENNGSLGSTLLLKCENHENQITSISCPEDFNKVPEGGCNLKCNYNLPCLHKCTLVCHGYDREHAVTKCTQKCERILCEHNHVCPLMCAEKCKPCMRLMMKEFPCGHSNRIACHKNPTDKGVLCTVTVQVTLPKCGHEAKKQCHMDVKYVACLIPCVFRVDKCGHACTRKCHVDDDPQHEKYTCEKPCSKLKKGCTLDPDDDYGDHRCNKKCYEECIDCNVEVEKKRSNCKHKERIACSKDVDSTPCRHNCARVLPCGHHCKKKCFETCGDCNIEVTKKIPGCEHEKKLHCKVEPKRTMCTQACERKLPCGHNCTGACKDECDMGKCIAFIPQQIPSPCGHKVSLPCSVYRKLYGDNCQMNEAMRNEQLLHWCRAPCGVELACGHFCSGTCGACRQGRLHQACGERCERTNICGHICQEPCNQVCPPCSRKCEVKCEHSVCNKVCGDTCKPCQEPCVRRCPHSSCRRRCGEACGRAACDEPCGRARPCAHPCRGLCGERCPDICKLCDPEHFPTDFLGDEFDDDAKFIILEDCGHIMEVETMDASIRSEKDSISIPTCPLCRKPVVNTPRYKDLIIHKFRTEINPVKERIYGSVIQRQQKKEVLIGKVIKLRSEGCADKEWEKAFIQIYHNVKIINKNESLPKLQILEVQIEVFEIISNIYKTYQGCTIENLQIAFADQFSTICRFILENLRKFGKQHQSDIGKEIKRLNAIANLSKVLKHPSYTSSKTLPKVCQIVESAKAEILSWKVFDEEKSKKLLEDLQETIKASGIISKEERDLIVKAIGLAPGRWFKCPNGHYYCIGECGGAMEVSKCPECKEAIGGTSHSLLRTNQHAPEMDGSRFAAWSEQANNMANFDLNDFL